jgi:pseudouridine synthase
MAARLMHPRYHVVKVYQVVVEGQPTQAIVRKLATGVELDDGVTLPAHVEVVDSRLRSTELRFELREGRNRQIRRMCAAVGHPVIRLCRLQIGPLGLGNLQPGDWRSLTPDEVKKLHQAVLAPQGIM